MIPNWASSCSSRWLKASHGQITVISVPSPSMPGMSSPNPFTPFLGGLLLNCLVCLCLNLGGPLRGVVGPVGASPVVRLVVGFSLIVGLLSEVCLTQIPLSGCLAGPWSHTRQVVDQCWVQMGFHWLLQALCGPRASQAVGAPQLLPAPGCSSWVRAAVDVQAAEDKMFFHALPLPPHLTRSYLIAPDSISVQFRA